MKYPWLGMELPFVHCRAATAEWNPDGEPTPVSVGRKMGQYVRRFQMMRAALDFLDASYADVEAIPTWARSLRSAEDDKRRRISVQAGQVALHSFVTCMYCSNDVHSSTLKEHTCLAPSYSYCFCASCQVDQRVNSGEPIMFQPWNWRCENCK
jgi:hypothetical protein